MKKLYFLLLLISPLCALAQSKLSAPTAIWPELQLSANLSGEGILFIQNQYRINTDSRFNDLKKSGILSSFERIEVSLGYEHTFSEHWRGGLITRFAAEDYPKSFFVSPFVRHNGNLAGLYFNKQLLFDYVVQEGRENFGRYNLSAELGKRLPVKNKFITPGISYEAMLLSEFGKDEDENQEKRVVDLTRLRLNLTYELTESLRITPYFMRQTDRYYVLIPPEYNEDGQLLKEGYTTKRNRITPVIGLELKYSFGRTPETASITY
ncbi:hypothetical protein H8S95_08230 [Pontibacter sp. KCTC 32443]|uniref:hypothetical protein n=1 Tax=Pontibacter TaxID=323449 RepID=UPI00164D4A07|nr:MULTISPECIES: hypothetical protein [Pontibacter]MBC5774049.1 hypothetical protein [Pontibacter sp. KCTC 32443]